MLEQLLSSSLFVETLIFIYLFFSLLHWLDMRLQLFCEPFYFYFSDIIHFIYASEIQRSTFVCFVHFLHVHLCRCSTAEIVDAIAVYMLESKCFLHALHAHLYIYIELHTCVRLRTHIFATSLQRLHLRTH